MSEFIPRGSRRLQPADKERHPAFSVYKAEMRMSIAGEKKNGSIRNGRWPRSFLIMRI
jgi:hypothetical protein